MSASIADRKLFEPASNADHLIPVGAKIDVQRRGRQAEGQVTLEKPNPAGRRNCKVIYVTRKHWPEDIDGAALRVAARWFRDIGGLATISNRVLGHIVARLLEGRPEEHVHWAVDAYAESNWHRERKAHMTIGRFFLGNDVDAWCEKSDRYRKSCAQPRRDLERREQQLAARSDRLQGEAFDDQGQVRDQAALNQHLATEADRDQLRCEIAATRERQRKAYESLPVGRQAEIRRRAEAEFRKKFGDAPGCGDMTCELYADLCYLQAPRRPSHRGVTPG